MPSNSKRLAFMYQLKLELGGCQLCGEPEPACLDFHHIKPSEKRQTLSKHFVGPVADFLAEIERCAIVCANCHRKLHHGIIDPEILKPVQLTANQRVRALHSLRDVGPYPPRDPLGKLEVIAEGSPEEEYQELMMSSEEGDDWVDRSLRRD